MSQIPDFNLKEDMSHGDILLPIQCYRCNFFENISTLPIHWHEEAEITLILEGSILYSIGFETYEVSAGDIILISPHFLHSAQLATGNLMVSETIVFHMDMLMGKTMDACSIKYLVSLQNGTYQFAPVIRASGPGYSEILSCFNELRIFCQNKNPGFELMLKHCLFKSIYLLYCNNYVITIKNIKSTKQTEETLKLILTYIDQHYNEPLTIQALADICHFSKCHFMNFFKKNVGISCMEYIIDYRINSIAEKLSTTQVSITDLAMEEGFNNISYFNRLFRRKFGTTPMKYKTSR